MLFRLLTLSLLVWLTAAWSPTDSYAPGEVDCPSGNSSLVRQANGLSENESEWLTKRHKVTDQALKDFLTYNISLSDFNVDNFFNNLDRSINIGLAFSGGGYRAMLAGAGQMAALDNRTTGGFTHGLGGLLQATTYMAGLSGGNWLTGTIAYNNFTSVQDILDNQNQSLWNLEKAIYNPGGINIFKSVSTFNQIAHEIEDKQKAGFNASITDIWARSLARQFFSNSDYGAALTVSTLRDADVFKNGEMPLPISIADGRYPHTRIISDNSTVFEINPFELGSWDPTLNAFTDIKYLGSNVTNGKSNNGTCIAGFDNASFMMGTSSSLFNQFLLQLNSTGISGTLYNVAQNILSKIDDEENDIADYTPNPFYGISHGTSKSLSSSKHLYLVDGGEDLQNVPLSPVIQPKRNVDVVFAFDNSADTDYSWPNGTSMVATYERQFAKSINGSGFPYVPDVNTFRSANLTSRPAFFGCDASNLTTLAKQSNRNESAIPPLVVYIANRPFSYYSNATTFTMSYDDEAKRGMIQNGFEVASRNNLTLDSDWKVCVACAIIRRSQERLNQTQSDQCKQCFEEYCWDGTYNEDEAGVNFTETGTTDGEESTNTTGAAVRLSSESTGTLLMWALGFVAFASMF